MDRISIKLIQRIREEFEEAPWLRFTVDEAAQFWGLERDVCAQVLARLQAVGFLASGLDHRFAVQFANPVEGSRMEWGVTTRCLQPLSHLTAHL